MVSLQQDSGRGELPKAEKGDSESLAEKHFVWLNWFELGEMSVWNVKDRMNWFDDSIQRGFLRPFYNTRFCPAVLITRIGLGSLNDGANVPLIDCGSVTWVSIYPISDSLYNGTARAALPTPHSRVSSVARRLVIFRASFSCPG
jgi:hypothetical protein